jgi:RNase adaptor protein for sRNA GlmZ degradation
MRKKAHVTTFGYEYGNPPEADRVYDVRDLHDHPMNSGKIEERAEEIMEELEAGDHIAIGCELGHDRSPHVAARIKKEFGATVEHRDKWRNDHAADARKK